MKKYTILCLLFAVLIIGCGKKDICTVDGCKNDVYKEGLCPDHYVEAHNENNASINTDISSQESAKDNPDAKDDSNSKDGGDSPETNDFSFKDLEEWSFIFSSGAGGWSTGMDIDAQGRFSGVFSDSDMGSIGDGYPNGTVYICEFNGELEPAVRVDEYTYKTRIKTLELAEKEGRVWIEDGIRHETSYPYGLDDAKDIFIYLPGSKVDELPEGFIDWVRYSIYDYNTGETATELDFYGLYNENSQMGFYSVRND